MLRLKDLKKLCENESFLNKYFTAKEQEYILSKKEKAQTMAGIYSAKEAVLKAAGLGIGSGKLSLKDIEILQETSGRPYVNITDKITVQLLEKNGKTHIDISISHTRDIASAVCLII